MKLLQERFQDGALVSGRREQGKARQASEVAVKFAGKLKAADAGLGEDCGLAQTILLLFGEWLVVVLPCGVDLIARLRSGGGEGGCGSNGSGAESSKNGLRGAAEDLEADRLAAGTQRPSGGRGFDDCTGQAGGGDEVAGGALRCGSPHALGDGGEDHCDGNLALDGCGVGEKLGDGCGGAMSDQADDVGMRGELDDQIRRERSADRAE